MKKEIFIYLYYLILLLLLTSRQNATVEPSFVVRLTFITAVVLPVFINKSLYYPALLTLFYSLSAYGFAYSYMPSMIYMYVIITLLFVILLIGPRAGRQMNSFFIAFTIYTLLVDIVNYGLVKTSILCNSFYCFVLLIAFLRVDRGKENSVNQLSLCFQVISIVLSALFLLNRHRFTTAYGFNTGLERSGWTDANYFGCVLGMGFIISVINLLKKDKKTLDAKERILSIATLVVSTPALVLNASRGAILATMISTMILFLFSETKTGYKILFLLLAVLFIYILYNNQYFDLLAYRLENDQEGGSGRSAIWASKIENFSQGDFINILIGYGHDGGWNITGTLVGFHNDYVAFLVEYGIIGIILFLNFLIYPIRIVIKKKGEKLIVFSLMLFLIISCFTLEPFGIGALTFYVFYLYVFLIAENGNNNAFPKTEFI